MTLARIPNKQDGKYRVYHWDTFEEEGTGTIQIGEESYKTFDEADEFVKEEYGDRIREDGADQVDIVRHGVIVKKYKVG